MTKLKLDFFFLFESDLSTVLINQISVINSNFVLRRRSFITGAIKTFNFAWNVQKHDWDGFFALQNNELDILLPFLMMCITKTANYNLYFLYNILNSY